MTVEELRKNGYKVRVGHLRKIADGIVISRNDFQNTVAADWFSIHWPDVVLPNGGKTVVEITAPNGKTVSGQARCHEKDNYNKRAGVRLAIDRAMIELGKQND